MACKGVDLTHPRWVLATATAMREMKPPLKLSDWEPIQENDTHFWDNLAEALKIRELGDRRSQSIDEMNSLIVNQRPTINSKVFAQTDSGLYVAFAFPYRTSPLLRKNLHQLSDFLTVGKSIPKERRSAVEAPIALAVECVAQISSQSTRRRSCSC